MLRAAVALVAVAGCATVFDLERVPPDARVMDSPIDEPPDLAITEHDEDGDGLGDSIDNCPHLPNADQLNSDGDQLGDACESLPGSYDCIARFDGFETLHDWISVRGTWLVDADQLVQTDADAADALIVTQQTYLRPHVEAVATAVAFGSLTSHNVGIWPAATYTSGRLPDGVTIEVVDSATVGQPALMAVTSSASNVATQLQPYAALQPQTDLRSNSEVHLGMELRDTPTAWIGYVRVNASELLQSGSNYDGSTARQVGMRVHGTIARYDWIWIVVRSSDGVSCPPRAP